MRTRSWNRPAGLDREENSRSKLSPKPGPSANSGEMYVPQIVRFLISELIVESGVVFPGTSCKESTCGYGKCDTLRGQTYT